MPYEHTQRGYLAFPVFIFFLIMFAILLASADEERGALAVIFGVSFFIVMLVVLWFSVLRIRVGNAEVRASFGGGWPRKIIALDEVVGFRQVRNKWYYGWGVRRAPTGWMFNVWGLDAVEIEPSNGKKFLIGTNEPAELVSALSTRVALAD